MTIRTRLHKTLRLFSLSSNHSPFFFHGFFCLLWKLGDIVPGRLGFAYRAWIGKRRLKKLGAEPHIFPHNLFFDGRKTEIGDHFYSGVYNYFAGGPVQIGDNVNLANFIVIETTFHHFDDPALPIYKQGVFQLPVVIEDDVWIGDRVTILGGVTIGRGSIIGAGAVVVKDIPPDSVAVGNPARVVRQRGFTKDGLPIAPAQAEEA
jgi:acetyltransferase-like isoleucine patch superfamily enzyme